MSRPALKDRRGGAAGAVLLLMAAACSPTPDRPALTAPPTDTAGRPAVTDTVSTTVIVSAPTAASTSVPGLNASVVGGTTRNAAATSAFVYVSLKPGSYPGGLRATIRNDRTRVSTVSWMVDGGLDPVAIEGDVGDQLTVDILRAAGTLSTTVVKVPK